MIDLVFDEIITAQTGSIDLDFALESGGNPEPEDVLTVNFSVSNSFSIRMSAHQSVELRCTASIDNGHAVDKRTVLKSSSTQKVDKKTVIAINNHVTQYTLISSYITGLQALDKKNSLRLKKLKKSDLRQSLFVSRLYSQQRILQCNVLKVQTADQKIAVFYSKTTPLDCKIKAFSQALLSTDTFRLIKWGPPRQTTTCISDYALSSGFIEFEFTHLDKKNSLDFQFDRATLTCTKSDSGSYRDYPSNWPDYDIPINDIQHVYFIMHNLTVSALPAYDEIDAIDIRMKIDIDSYAWSLAMNVADGIELIKPGELGVKETQINIDGHKFNFIVESYTQNEQFASKSWFVSGRSKTAYLTAPYKLPISATYGDALLASQIVNTELLNSGFTFSYATVDWLVTASAFSYQNLTTLQAVKHVSDAIGGVILPHREDSQITINPRYKYSPWDWMTSTPKATLTSDIFISMSGNWQPKPDINGVYVGGNTTGVECFVKRTGTAGNKLSRQVVENLITHQDAGRERGRNIICDRGKQEVVSIKMSILPIGETPSIYDCGDLLEIIQPTSTWRGIVIGIEIYIERATETKPMKATQTLFIERHYGNN